MAAKPGPLPTPFWLIWFRLHCGKCYAEACAQCWTLQQGLGGTIGRASGKQQVRLRRIRLDSFLFYGKVFCSTTLETHNSS